MAVVRRAVPADSAAGADLILMAGDLIAEQLFGSEHHHAISVVRHLFEYPCNLFSFDRAWVAIEQEEIAALLHGFPGYEEGHLALSTLRFLPSILHIVGARRMLRLIQRAPQFFVPLSSRQERRYLLVNALAVYERFRRRGLATLLLEVAEQEARQLKLPYLRLVVRTDNEPALATYKKFGFTLLDEMARCLYLNDGRRILWALMEKTVT